MLAVLRNLSGPVLYPIRLLATVYVDVFRALPGILVIFVLGFGIRACACPASPATVLLGHRGADAHLLRVRLGGVSGRHRIGPSVAGGCGAVAGPIPAPGDASCRPQAVRRVIPPLLNDFIGLQKDTVLVSFIGVVEIFRQTQIRQQATFNFTPYIVTALVFLALTIPLARLTDWLVSRERDRRYAAAVTAQGPARRGRIWLRPMTGPMAPQANGQALVVEGLWKSFGDSRPARDRPEPGRARDRGGDRCIGLRKSTLLRCLNLLEPIDAGRIVVAGEEITAPGVDVDRLRRRIGIVFQAYNLFPHMTVLDNVTLAPRKAMRTPPAEAEAAATRLLERFGLADKRLEYPDRLRAAAARGDRARAGHATLAPAARRDHLRARPGAGGRGAQRRASWRRRA